MLSLPLLNSRMERVLIEAHIRQQYKLTMLDVELSEVLFLC